MVNNYKYVIVENLEELKKEYEKKRMIWKIPEAWTKAEVYPLALVLYNSKDRDSYYQDYYFVSVPLEIAVKEIKRTKQIDIKNIKQLLEENENDLKKLEELEQLF